MKINAFFEHCLRAPLYNHVWSWGAVNKATNTVFLRIGEHEIGEYSDGKTWVTAYNPEWNTSPGHGERLSHLKAIQNGADGYAVLVYYGNNEKIVGFDDQKLFKLGGIVEEQGCIYAEIVREVPVAKVVSRTHPTTAADDIEDVIDSGMGATERRAYIDARLGQGAFREEVLRRWSYKCAVTSISTISVIRASHIKPWRDSTDQERLDPSNGLPLVATFDALFDVGFISFYDSGELMTSVSLPREDAKKMSLSGCRLAMRPSKKVSKYLQYHRDKCFQR